MSERPSSSLERVSERQPRCRRGQRGFTVDVDVEDGVGVVVVAVVVVVVVVVVVICRWCCSCHSDRDVPNRSEAVRGEVASI